MSIQEFKSNIRTSGLAKANRYLVELNAPPTLNSRQEPFISNLRMIRLMCDSAQLPGTSFGTNPVRSYGETREVAYERIFEPITLTFYMDKDLLIKRMFDVWIESVQSIQTRDFNYPSDYLCPQMSIHVYDISNTPVYTTTLFNAFPKQVQAINLDYGSRDIMKLTVTMQYEWYESGNTISGSVGNARVVDSLPALGRDSYIDNFVDYQDAIYNTSAQPEQIVSSFYSSPQRLDPLWTDPMSIAP